MRWEEGERLGRWRERERGRKGRVGGGRPHHRFILW